jgi:hypothetical protein
VPNDVAVPRGPRRKHVLSLAEVAVDDLWSIYSQLSSQFGERTA